MDERDLGTLCKKIHELDTLKKKHEDRAKELVSEAHKLKIIVLKIFDAGKIDEHSTMGLKAKRVSKKSVQIEDRNLLMNWLESKGILRDSVRLTTVDAYTIWKNELAAAKEIDLETYVKNPGQNFILTGIPGVSTPSSIDVIKVSGKLTIKEK